MSVTCGVFHDFLHVPMVPPYTKPRDYITEIVIQSRVDTLLPLQKAIFMPLSNSQYFPSGCQQSFTCWHVPLSFLYNFDVLLNLI